MKVGDYIARHSQLQKDRDTLDWHLQEVADITLPRNSLFTFKSRTPGEKRNTRQFDSTAEYYNSILAAGMHGMLTNPSARWFTIKPERDALREDKAVQEWLEAVTDIMYSAINAPSAAFSNNMHEFYLEYGAFATACLFVSEAESLNGNLLFNCRALSECLIAENANGFVDTVYRKFKMTLRQVVQKWGESSLATGDLRAFKKGQFDKEIDVLHAVQPRADSGKVKGTKGLPIASVYIDVSQKKILHESGYHEMPYFAGRFYKAPGETYGRGPGTMSLPDNKMLQEMSKVVIKAAQLRAAPPLQAPDDGFIGAIRTLPFAINYYRSGEQDRIEPINMGGDIGITLEMMDSIRTRIGQAFFVDQLQVDTSGPRKTATEWLGRTEDRLRLLGPVMGRVQSEVLGPMIDRIFGILSRARKFPPPPEGFGGEALKIEYESPMAKAQQQLEANGIVRGFEVAALLIDRDPKYIDNFDGDFMLRDIFRMFNVNSKAFKAIEDVQTSRQQAAEAANMAQETQTAKDGSLAINQLAQAANAGGLVEK